MKCTHQEDQKQKPKIQKQPRDIQYQVHFKYWVKDRVDKTLTKLYSQPSSKACKMECKTCVDGVKSASHISFAMSRAM